MNLEPFFRCQKQYRRYAGLLVTLVLPCLIFSCQDDIQANRATSALADTGSKKVIAQAPYTAQTQVTVNQQRDSELNNKEKATTGKNQPAIKNTPAIYIEPRMVLVKGGRFIMGSNKSRDKSQHPEHVVHISDFMMGKYEVTVGEFRKFINSHTYVTDAEKDGFSYSFDGKNLIFPKKGVNWECDVLGNRRVNEEDHPVIHVSQNDAMAYCKWLSMQSGKEYRLPTEAEWEYAAKGGPRQENFLYSGGNNMESIGWYAWNSNYATHPVGKKAPNGLGLYDMSGNVWEWCSDWLGPYRGEEQTNPKGSDTGSFAVMRGGGWRFFAIICTNTQRRGMPPGFNGSGPGFRLASSLPQTNEK
jgi:formylglycine-generating enzyme required for sulfatase activity